MLTVLLLLALLVALTPAAFVWWGFVLCGARVVNLPSSAEGVLAIVDVIVDVDALVP